MRWVRVATITAFVGIFAWMTLSGAVSLLLGVALFLPVSASLVFAELGRGDSVNWAPGAECARWSRSIAGVGLIVWLWFAGGASLLVVVAAVILMIFLHELGHYMAAKRAGMLVTEFFLGFGPKIWSFHRGDTEFGLKAVPAGAYVKIIGMNSMEEVDPADEARTYRQGKFGDRMLVAVAGSGMHFLIALVLLFVQFAFIGAAHETEWTIGSVSEGSPAQSAGLSEGDKVLSLNGAEVGSFSDFRDLVREAPSGDAELVVERSGEPTTIDLELARRAAVIGTVGDDVNLVETGDGVIVGGLVNNGRGERGGLAEGDTVTAVNGVGVASLDDVPDAVDKSLGGIITFTVLAGDGSTATEQAEVDLGSEVGFTEPASFVGIGSQPELVTSPPLGAAGEAVQGFGDSVVASVQGVGTVFWPPNLLEFVTSSFTGETQDVSDEPTPADQVAVSSDGSRPTSIFGAIAYGADMTAQNASFLIAFMIALNIFIGVFNLIPLLPFDGGHVAIAVYEKAQEVRRRTKDRYIADVTRMIPVAYTVVMVLAVVGLLAMYLDLTQGVAA
jgi:RIP metalloprotease RseP